MAVLLSSNIAAINCGGVLSANSSPLTNIATQALTGMCAIAPTLMSITSNATLSTDINLQCTLNETGVYKIDGCLGFYCTTSAIANVRLTLGGTATINSLMMFMMGSSGVAGAANLVQSNTATFGNTSTAAANANVQIANVTSLTINQPDVVVIGGLVRINTTGTLFPMWAQATSATSAVNRVSNSYFMLTKIN